jgi:anti-sigma factor RsiW
MTLRWFRRRSRDLVCIEFVEVVTDYLEGELPARQRARFEQHFGACPHCSRYLEQLRRTIDLTGHLTTDDVDALPLDTRSDLLAAFRGYQGV